MQLPHVNVSYNTDIDDQMYCEIKLKPPWDVIPKEELDLANHKLISVLNSSAQVYHKV